jgi:hypothetical protein
MDSQIARLLAERADGGQLMNVGRAVSVKRGNSRAEAQRQPG